MSGHALLERIEHSNGIVTYQSPRFRERGIRHAFSTRVGGVSPAPFDSLNLGNPGSGPIDDLTNIDRNFERLQEAIGCTGSRRVRVSQVHGKRVHQATGDETWNPPLHEADAIISARADTLIAIRVADCVPILLADASGRYVAAVHAGWRGVVANVVVETVDELGRVFGCKVHELLAAVGPCIGRDAFEVGPEVADEFVGAGLADAVVPIEDANPHVDLVQSVVSQLQRAGVELIDVTDRCTYRDRDEFFSHRRDQGRSGRLAASIIASA